MRRPSFLVLAFAALIAATPAAAQKSASAPVEHLNTTLLDVMQNAETLGYEGRVERLAPEMRAAFDFATMARVSLGSRQWRKLAPAQQDAFVKAFGDFSIAVFADRFDGYSGERFEILGEQPGQRSFVLVRNQIVKGDGEAIAVNYLTRPDKDRGWQIVDILLDAQYSEVAARRSEYSGIVKRGGIDALIAALKDKTAGYSAAP